MSYNLRRFVNNNESNRAHPTDWELWSSADGATWVKMDERSGQTFDGSSSRAMMSPQYAYTYNHHVPYLFNALNVSWRFDTFGTISVAAGAVLDLDSIPDANIAINALSVDLTAGAGTITKFVPAENETIYQTHPRVCDYAPNGELNSKIVLPLTIGTVLSPEKLKSWQVVVDGTPITNGELAVRDGALVVLVHHGLLLIFR